MDITDHYTVGECFSTLAEAQEAAGNDPDRIWFVRGGDDTDTDEDGYLIDEDGKPVRDDNGNLVDYTWDVELWDGQFVNCLGFFVSTEPCRPEHRNTVFTY
jgi:hypothetical protein